MACAGCVVYRRTSDGHLEVLVAARRNGVWTFPKGKVRPGEALREAATREVAEEAGVRVRAGVELGATVYPVGSGRFKVVSWFAGEFRAGAPTPDGRELVELRWVSPAAAVQLLPTPLAVQVETLSAMLQRGFK